MRYEVRLSARAAKDLDRLNRETQQRMIKRLERLGEVPRDPRLSSLLTSQGGLRRSRVVTIERLGQVYRRI